MDGLGIEAMKNAILLVFGTLMVLFGTTSVLFYLKMDSNFFNATGGLLSTFTEPSNPPSPSVAKKHFRGQIFIVTRGGESVPLGGIIVSFYTLQHFQEVLPGIYQKIGKDVANLAPVYEAKVKAQDAALQAYEKISARHPHSDKALNALGRAEDEHAEWVKAYFALVYMTNAQAYANALPNPYVTSQTSPDGKFNLEVSTELPLVATACADRQIGQKTENYCWFITMDGSKEIFLNNHNKFGSGSPDSAIPMPELPDTCENKCVREVEALKSAYAQFSMSLTP